MPRYILTRFTTPVSETYNTLDEALAECFKADGRYIIDTRDTLLASREQYFIEVTNGIASVQCYLMPMPK